MVLVVAVVLLLTLMQMLMISCYDAAAADDAYDVLIREE